MIDKNNRMKNIKIFFLTAIMLFCLNGYPAHLKSKCNPVIVTIIGKEIPMIIIQNFLMAIAEGDNSNIFVISCDDKVKKEEHTTYPSLPKLAEQILNLAQEYKKITVAEVLDATNAPRSTVKKYINMLVDQKYLMRYGKGRGVWYAIVT